MCKLVFKYEEAYGYTTIKWYLDRALESELSYYGMVL